MDFKNILGKITEKWEQIQKWFWNITNYYTSFDYIKAAKNIWIIWHDRIDWDSLGSVLAMEAWLKNKFTDKKITTYTSSKPSSDFDFLEVNINFAEDLKIDENTDLLILLDCANLERLWKLYENNKELIDSKDKINIDHHFANTNFGIINIVNPDSSSTAEVLYDYFDKLETWINNIINSTSNWIDSNVAKYLLLGILTDSWVFSTQNSWAKTLEIAAELIKKWVDKNHLIQNLYQNKTLESFKLEANILSKVEYVNHEWVKFAFSFVEKKELDAFWIEEDDFSTKWIVAKLKEIKDTDFVYIAKTSNWKTYISFRSKTYDVAKLAENFWWWWHKCAAACVLEWELTWEQVKEKIQSVVV